MSDLNTQCLDTFPTWLKSLGEDARALVASLSEETSGAVRRPLAGALNYLFKSLDLIPDGIEDLGFIDDAFVIRVCCKEAAGAGAQASQVAALAAQADLIAQFLGSDFARLERYCAELKTSVARGRSVDALISEPATFNELVNDVKSWAKSYEAPSFGRDEKNLVKLKAFLAAKLPG